MAAIDYDTQLSRVHMLLVEWGECQDREPSPRVQGYPRASVEGRMMDQWGERADGTSPVCSRSAGPAPKQTMVRVVKTGDEWPEHIQRVDRILARLDRDTFRVLKARYIIGLETVREIANYFLCSKSAVATRLERARWFLLGALAEVDA